MDIVDEAGSDNDKVRVTSRQPPQVYHCHMNFSSKVGSSGISIKTKAFTIDAAQTSARDANVIPSPSLTAPIFDSSSLLAGFSALSFIDPDYTAEETLCAQARNATASKTLITPTPNTTHTNPQVRGGF